MFVVAASIALTGTSYFKPSGQSNTHAFAKRNNRCREILHEEGKTQIVLAVDGEDYSSTYRPPGGLGF